MFFKTADERPSEGYGWVSIRTAASFGCLVVIEGGVERHVQKLYLAPPIGGIQMPVM